MSAGSRHQVVIINEVGKPVSVDCSQGGIIPPGTLAGDMHDVREVVKQPDNSAVPAGVQPLHKVKIALPGNAYSGSVELDGKPLRGVTRIEVGADAPSTSKVKLTMIADLEIEGDADVKVENAALESFHSQSRNNRAAIMESQLAGCFFCLGLIVPSAVHEWVDEEGNTGVCPECGIDSLIPRMEQKSPLLLLQLRRKYFDE